MKYPKDFFCLFSFSIPLEAQKNILLCVPNEIKGSVNVHAVGVGGNPARGGPGSLGPWAPSGGHRATRGVGGDRFGDRAHTWH